MAVGFIEDDCSLDEIHDIEVGTVHGVVGAEADDSRDGYIGVLQRRNDAMFAAHVVGAGQYVARWGASQYQFCA